MSIFWSVLERSLFPLDVGSVVTTSRDDVLGLLVFVPESDSWNVLGVTGHSSARLSVVEDREFVDSDRAKIITSDEMSSISGGINSVNISSITSLREHTSNFPTKFTSGSGPDCRIDKCGLTVRNLLRLFNIVKDLGVGLIDGSEEFRVSRPIHTNNSRGMDKGD